MFQLFCKDFALAKPSHQPILFLHLRRWGIFQEGTQTGLRDVPGASSGHTCPKQRSVYVNEHTFTILGGDKGVGTRWARRHKGAQGRLSEKARDMYVKQLHLLQSYNIYVLYEYTLKDP